MRAKCGIFRLAGLWPSGVTPKPRFNSHLFVPISILPLLTQLPYFVLNLLVIEFNFFASDDSQSSIRTTAPTIRGKHFAIEDPQMT
jgi:hypothetical protein